MLPVEAHPSKSTEIVLITPYPSHIRVTRLKIIIMPQVWVQYSRLYICSSDNQDPDHMDARQYCFPSDFSQVIVNFHQWSAKNVRSGNNGTIMREEFEIRSNVRPSGIKLNCLGSGETSKIFR